MRYLLDTNVVIYLMNGHLANPLPPGRYSVSVVTEIELLSFPDLEPDKEHELRQFLALTDRLPLSDTVRDETIRLRRAHRLRLPDAIIAASAAAHGAVLLTNDKGLHGLPGVETQTVVAR